MWWRTFRYQTVDSTSDRAFDALERGEGRHLDVFIARSQLTGRGTRGRRWTSHEGGLYLSVILESPSIPPPGLWTIAGALAVHDAATELGATVELDWPNDLVSMEGGKVAGVLAESRGLRATGAAIFVLGIGVNVLGRPASEELDRVRPTTSLDSLASSVSLEGAERALLEALEERVKQALRSPGSVYGDFYARCAQRGAEVAVDVGETRVTGRLEGLTPDGSLRLLDPVTGTHRRISIAHVRSVRALDTPGS